MEYSIKCENGKIIISPDRNIPIIIPASFKQKFKHKAAKEGQHFDTVYGFFEALDHDGFVVIDNKKHLTKKEEYEAYDTFMSYLSMGNIWGGL